MTRRFPEHFEDIPRDAEPRVVSLTDDDAGEIFAALSNETAQEIFRLLHEDPSTASELAEQVDASIQTVGYHLGNLEEAGLVEVARRTYSERGNEMKIYVPVGGPLVLTGNTADADAAKGRLSRLLGAVAVVLGGLAALVQWVLVPWLVDRQKPDPGGPVGPGGPGPGIEEVPGAGQATYPVPPGVLFLAGGLVVCLVGLAVLWYRR